MPSSRYCCNRNHTNRALSVFDNLHVSKLYIHNLPHQNSMLDEQMPYYINHLGSNFSAYMRQSHKVHLDKKLCNILFRQKIKKRCCFFDFSPIFFMFLANCCLLMASLTFSFISGIPLLFLIVLGMILIPSECVGSYCAAQNRAFYGNRKTAGKIDLTSWIR